MGGAGTAVDGASETGSATAAQLPRAMGGRSQPACGRSRPPADLDVAALKCCRAWRVHMPRMRSALPPLLALAAAVPALADPTGSTVAPEASFVRTAHAARRVGSPIVIDGRMDEPAWPAAPLEDNFTQVNPDEGKPASVHTPLPPLCADEFLSFCAIFA